MAVQINRLYKDEIFREFAGTITDFFDISTIGESSRGSLTRGLVERIERALANKAEKDELLFYILKSSVSLEQNWNEIGQHYAKTKIYCLSSPQLINKPK